jgi:hypothetical protein
MTLFELPQINIPIIWLLVPYGLILLFLATYSFFNTYHLLRFATYSFGSYVVTTLFIGGSIIIAAVSFYYLSAVDWSATWNLNSFFELKI